MVQILRKRGGIPTALDIAMAWDKENCADDFDQRKQNLNELTRAANTFVHELKWRLS